MFDCGFFVGDDGKMHGDVCTEEAKEVAGWLAAVPGGSLYLPFVLYFKLKLCEKMRINFSWTNNCCNACSNIIRSGGKMYEKPATLKGILQRVKSSKCVLQMHKFKIH